MIYNLLNISLHSIKVVALLMLGIEFHINIFLLESDDISD